MNRIQNSPRAARSHPLAVPFLGVSAALQLIDPIVTSMVLLQAANSLQLKGAKLALAASISTLALAATVLVMGFLADRLGSVSNDPLPRCLVECGLTSRASWRSFARGRGSGKELVVQGTSNRPFACIERHRNIASRGGNVSTGRNL